jgi:hypothetical protein
MYPRLEHQGPFHPFLRQSLLHFLTIIAGPQTSLFQLIAVLKSAQTGASHYCRSLYLSGWLVLWTFTDSCRAQGAPNPDPELREGLTVAAQEPVPRACVAGRFRFPKRVAVIRHRLRQRRTERAAMGLIDSLSIPEDQDQNPSDAKLP